MKVSVAMTTYKSCRFVKEQLESIFNQTRIPDELIICDDASPDNTALFVKEIIQKAPLEIDIKLFVNTDNLGFVKNFEKSMSLCSGDVIFLCDADDIWEINKIENILRIFSTNNNAVMAFHDAVIIDDQGLIIKESLNAGWDVRSDKTSSKELQILNVRRKGVPYGLTMALRKSILKEVLPLPIGYGHDEWLGLCAPLFGDVVTSSLSLARYRRHLNNTSNNRPSIIYRLIHWDRESWFTHAQEIKGVYNIFLERYGNVISSEVKAELLHQIEFQTLLEKIINRKCWGGLKLLYFWYKGDYQKYRGTKNTLLLDELYLLLHMFIR